MADQTEYLGLHTRGPFTTSVDNNGVGAMDCDQNMRILDAECERLTQAVTLLGGNLSGTVVLDSGEWK